MSGNCNSSPLSGCTDSKTLEQLELLSEMVETKLTSINSKKAQIIIDLNSCADANNAILEDIVEKYETLIDDDCCDEINANLQDIIDALNGKIYSGSCELEGTIEGYITPTTTATPTTTVYTPTTTSAPTTTAYVENSDTFFVSTVAMLPCIEYDLPAENEKTLHYTGTFGVGSQMYTDEVGGILLQGFTYIKKLNSLSVYSLGSENGVVGAIAYTCE